MKRKKLLLLFVCLFVMGLFFWRASVKSGFSETEILKEADIEQAYGNVLGSAVRIYGCGIYGSGNIYDVTEEDIIIVTVGHVLSGFDEDGYVTFFDGKEVNGRVIGKDIITDVGFVAVSKDSFSKEETLNYCMVKRDIGSYENAKKNDCFFMIDMATDVYHPVYYEGGIVEKDKKLEEFQIPMLYGDGGAVAGMSGCGVFDEYGNYIAMLAGSTEQAEIAAIPFTVIEEEYRRLKR